jgi:hypothetical protein
VANTVADPDNGKDSITYDAAGYAAVRNFPVATVQNAAGVFQQPNEANVTDALRYASPVGDGTFRLDFTTPDPAAYFPSTYSYALAQTTGFDPAKGAVLGQFLCYAVSASGQAVAVPLRYARLSNEIVNIAVAAISAVPGAPQPNSCATARSLPPPVGGGGPSGGGGGASGNANGAAGGTHGSAASAGHTTGIAGTGTTGAGTTGAGTTDTGASTTSSTDVTGDQGGTGGTQDLAAGQTATSLANTTKPSGPSTAQAAWAVFEGALLCAVVVAAVQWRKRGAEG